MTKYAFPLLKRYKVQQVVSSQRLTVSSGENQPKVQLGGSSYRFHACNQVFKSMELNEDNTLNFSFSFCYRWYKHVQTTNPKEILYQLTALSSLKKCLNYSKFFLNIPLVSTKKNTISGQMPRQKCSAIFTRHPERTGEPVRMKISPCCEYDKKYATKILRQFCL